MSTPPAVKLIGVVPRAWTIVGFSAALVMSGYSWFTYKGLYRLASELQLRLMGEYSIKLSVLLTALGYGLGFALLMRLLVAVKLIRHASQAEIDAYVQRAHGGSRTGGPLVFAIMIAPWALIGLGAGVYTHFGAQETNTTELTMLDISNGKNPSANYVSLNGLLLSDGRISYGTHGSLKSYIPLVPIDWAPPDPIRVFVETQELPKEGLFRAIGMRYPLGVPGPVEAEFEKLGIPVEGAMLITLNTTPVDWKRWSDILLILGGIGMAISAVSVVLGVRRRKRENALTPAAVTPADSSGHSTMQEPSGRT